MSEATKGKGSCLCGAVSIIAGNVSNSVGACHCEMCRKWTGGPFMAVSCGSGVSFTGEDNISVYKSSEWAERGFCKNCGTHLFYRLKQKGEYMVPAGLFDDKDSFVFDTQIFIDKKPSYYSFANKTKDMTAEEVFELFG